MFRITKIFEAIFSALAPYSVNAIKMFWQEDKNTANLNRKRARKWVQGGRGGLVPVPKRPPQKVHISSSRLPTHIPGINRHAECFIRSIRVFSAVRIGAKKSKTALYRVDVFN